MDKGTEEWRCCFNWKEKEEGKGKGMMIGRTRDEKEILEKEGK
jgi:hypothetical protein